MSKTGNLKAWGRGVPLHSLEPQERLQWRREELRWGCEEPQKALLPYDRKAAPTQALPPPFRCHREIRLPSTAWDSQAQADGPRWRCVCSVAPKP